MIEQWLSVSEAASTLGVSDSTVRRRAQRGDLSCRMNSVGRLEVLVQVSGEADEAIAAALVQNRQGTSQAAPQQTIKPARTQNRIALTDANTAETGDAFLDHAAPPKPSGTQAKLNPFLQNTAKGETASDESQDLSRYQRMAGASMVLAQKQADEAAEELAHVRYSLGQTRNHFRIATATALFFALCTTFMLFTSRGDGNPAKRSITGPQTATAAPSSSHEAIIFDEYGFPLGDPASPAARQPVPQSDEDESLREEVEALRKLIEANEREMRRVLRELPGFASSTSSSTAG